MPTEVSVTEGDAGTVNAVFDITLSEPLGVDVSADVETTEASAEAPEDYADTEETVTFTAGTVSQQVSVPVNGDVDSEFDEVFFLDRSNVTGPPGTDEGNEYTVATIVNDDVPPPALSIADSTLTEGNSGTSSMPFTVTLENGPADRRDRRLPLVRRADGVGWRQIPG